jgi:hypothetical protein
MWDPKVYNDKVRHQNMSRKFERSSDIVKRVTTKKNPRDVFTSLINRKPMPLSIIGSNQATPKHKKVKIVVTSYEQAAFKANPFKPKTPTNVPSLMSIDIVAKKFNNSNNNTTKTTDATVSFSPGRVTFEKKQVAPIESSLMENSFELAASGMPSP